HLLELHEQAELQRAGDRRVETLADARLQIEAAQIAHDIARGVDGAPLTLRALESESLQFAGAVAMSGCRVRQHRRLDRAMHQQIGIAAYRRGEMRIFLERESEMAD